MANKNFKNNSPLICAAGKPSVVEETVASLLKFYPIDDVVDAIKHEANIPDKEPFKYKLPPLYNFRNAGVYTEVKKILNPPIKTRFQTIVNDLKETVYKSYWTTEDGRPTDSIGNLPNSIDPYTTTFGTPSKKDLTVKELVNPNKHFDEVACEFVKGHTLYKKSHNDYYPNERINRNYMEPAYNPNKIFGEYKGLDPRGLLMKCCMNTGKDTCTVVNTVLSDYQKRSVPKLGKPFAPNNNIAKFPKRKAFGRPSIKEDTIAELTTENPEPELEIKIKYYLTFVNPLRSNLKDRFNKNLFSFSQFLDALKYHDKEKTGWIPLSTAYEMCKCFKLFFNKIEVEKFLKLFGIIKNNQLDYNSFLKVINWQEDFPNISTIYHGVPKVKYYETSYKASQEDYKLIDNSRSRPAGLPCPRLDKKYPSIPEGGCRADIESYGSETEAKTVLTPSVYNNYGLSFFDFFAPREKDVIQNVFTNVGYKLDDETFEKLWNEGCEIDKTGLVCADTFKKLVRKHDIEYVKEKKRLSSE